MNKADSVYLRHILDAINQISKQSPFPRGNQKDSSPSKKTAGKQAGMTYIPYPQEFQMNLLWIDTANEFATLLPVPKNIV